MATTPQSLYHLTPLRRAARDIQALFSARSSLPVIAARDLQRTLRAAFPRIPITDTTPVLLTPNYRYSQQAIHREGYTRTILVDELINRFVDGFWVDYTQGQLLTEQPDSEPVVIAALKNLDVQTAINTCGPLLLERCQEVLLDDWCELSIEARSRFESLSQLLKETLRQLSVPTLVMNAAHRRMIADVLQVPDNNLRTGTTRAYLVDQWGDAGGANRELLRGMVLGGPSGTGETLLLFTLSAGIEVFSSRDDLAAALRSRLTGLAPGREMQWRLYEPCSNIFDGFALSFLAKQLSDLRSGVELARRSAYWSSTLLETVHWVVTGDFDSLRLDTPGMDKLFGALPGWVKRADREVRGLFSQYLQGLGTLFNQPNWRFFDDGVPSLLDFTRQALMAAYPQPSSLEPSDVIITVHTVNGVSAAGGFPVKVITTLLKVALENLASLPGERIEVTLRNGTTPPRWLTPEAIKRLVIKVDIGENYSRQVKARLKETPAEVLWRHRSFIEQLRLELPMLALEYSSRGQWGFSRRGYETVAAVMQAQAAERYLGNQVIVLRPLAFKATASATADVVTNMFVIGPRALDAGPVVLYRPMAQPKLLEFAGRAELFSAIDQPGELQQQVLAWMSADARATYRDQGFAIPHFNTLDGLALLIDALTSTPAQLGTDEVSGDYGQHLYQSQVQAILEQADRQSVSNRENLWARRMEGLSLGLNSVMPLVTGPLSVIGWLQVAWAVHEQLGAAASGANEDDGATLASFFLNMALVLMHYSRDALSERINTSRQEDNLEAPGLVDTVETPVSVPDNPVHELPAMDAASDVNRAHTPVEYGWLSVSRQLTPSQQADLRSFSVARPAMAVVGTDGMTIGLLSSDGQWFAEVDGECFKVSVERDGVRVVAANGRRGPWLKVDSLGRWRLDLRLRLLGGAPSGEVERIAQAHELKARFDVLYGQYSEAHLPDTEVIGQLRILINLSERLAGIDREIDNVVLLQQRAKLLLDLLEQRRRVEVVLDYAALRHRFLATQVHCLRFQIRLMEVRRTTQYQQVSDPSNAYLLTLHEVTKHTLSETMHQGLRAIARTHGQTVQLCREQRLAYEAMLDTVRADAQQLSTLDTPEWRGKAPILAWLEAALRPMVLRCMKAKAAAPGMEALSLLQDVHLRCRLKLSSYRQLCVDPAFNAEQRSQVLNDAVDELAWLDVRLAQAAATPNNFIDLSALEDYREYIQGLREEILQDTLQHYVDQMEVWTAPQPPSEKIIQSRHFGRLIASQRESSEIGESVAFTDPYTGHVYARFSPVEGNGETDWVYQDVDDAQLTSLKPQSYITSWQLLQRCTAALEQLPGLETHPRIAPRTVRAELELLAEMLFEDVQRSREARQGTEQRDPLKELLEQNQTAKANELIKAAREAYQRMVLAREPSTTAIADLLAEGAIEIREVPDTKRAPGVASPPLFRSFYIQKVQAAGQATEVLWFAHFHYLAGHSGGPLGFHLAHLKSGNAPVDSFEQRIRAVRGNNARLLSVFRTTIEREAARTLFFSHEVTAAQ